MLPALALLAFAAAPLDEEAPAEPPAAVQAAEDAEAPEELRWLALSGATAIGLGVVGVTAAGIWFAAVDGRQAEAPEGAREVALAGVFVSTGVIAIGAGLVLADALLVE